MREFMGVLVFWRTDEFFRYILGIGNCKINF